MPKSIRSIVTTSVKQVIEEMLFANQHQDASGEGRLVLHLVDEQE